MLGNTIGKIYRVAMRIWLEHFSIRDMAPLGLPGEDPVCVDLSKLHVSRMPSEEGNDKVLSRALCLNTPRSGCYRSELT